MKHYYKTIVLFCLGLCVCSAAPVYAQGKKEVAKNVIRKLTPQEASNKRIHAILWEKAKASRAERAIKKNMRMQSAMQAANNYHPLTEKTRIVPTPKEQLKFNAYRLTPDQIQTQAAKYEELMQQFLAFKQNWDAHRGEKKPPRSAGRQSVTIGPDNPPTRPRRTARRRRSPPSGPGG